MSCPFCQRNDTDGLLCDDDHCRELPVHTSDPFTGRSKVPLPNPGGSANGKSPECDSGDSGSTPDPPSKLVRYEFPLDSTTFRRLGRAKANRDNIPGRRIA